LKLFKSTPTLNRKESIDFIKRMEDEDKKILNKENERINRFRKNN